MVFGFVGAVGLLAILAYICLKILADSRIAKDNLGKFICMGTFGLILAHCIMNIGMVLKVMPVIGIPLPFLSAGGTAMVSMYVAIGLVLSTYTHSNKKYNVFYEEEE
ncbi:bacterial cell division membrane protein [Ruminococcus sp. CAG:624]|nr:bacterial cell division membrane protein [Ruminococcus sp. CAG:624]